MERKIYQPTEKQLEKWNALAPAEMPSDDEFKAKWSRAHHGTERGWGMGKRNWVALHSDDSLTQNAAYMTGLWQGRIDAMNELESQPTPQYHTDPYQYGYYAGYNNFASFWRGYDAQSKNQLMAQYGK